MFTCYVRKIFLFLFLFLISFVSFVPANVWAQSNFVTGNTPTLQKETTINEDYFTTGGTVVVSGTVNGDVYAAGGNILINGIVNGDVLAAGGNVTINGTVTGNVRVVGGQLVVGGVVGRNVSMAGGNITIEDPAKIAGSVTAAGGVISLLAPVGRNVTVGGNEVTINTTVGGNVNAAGQSLHISPSSHIVGHLQYWSSTKTQIANGVVGQDVTYHYVATSQQQQKKIAPEFISGFSIIWEMISLVSAFVIGLIMLWLVPLYMKNMTSTITTRLGVSLGIGFLGIVVMPVAFVILLLTIIGIPLAFILLGIFMLFAFLNKIFISYAIGKKLLPDKMYLALLVGLMIYGIISVIPIVGGIWKFVALCVGLGAFLLMKKDMYPQARAKKII